MSAKDALLEEIQEQPEPVLQEVLHYLNHIERQRADAEWADVLPGRAIEQEVASLTGAALDHPPPARIVPSTS